MEQVSVMQPAQGGSTPLDTNGLCLLSLDGGGVRGLSSLYILKSLMLRLKHERQAANISPSALKPCEIFDLIGGTSTGGLIAIMLGRLEMDVDECIEAYTKLSRAIFEKASSRIPLSLRGNIKPRFDSGKLESAIKEVIEEHGASAGDCFNDKKERGCKVFVCATARESKGITRLRSYTLADELDTSATILEAALATSAATSFFKPVCIGSRWYVDGALGANNPVEEVEDEASNIWCSQTANLKPLVKCFISIGTGNPGKKDIEDNVLKFFTTLKDIATETEKTARNFVARWRGHYYDKRYFRFNVQQGLQDVALEEYQAKGKIEAVTTEYLTDQEQKFYVQDCISNLKQKQNKTELGFDPMVPDLIGKLSISGSGAPKTHWHVPFTRNHRFVGRSSELGELEKRLFGDGHCHKVAITGLGGIGKTQIALEFAYRTTATHPTCSVLWVLASTLENVEKMYLEIGLKLQIPGVADENADVKLLVRQRLSQERAGQWLMILDNADDIDLWFEAKGNGTQGVPLIDYVPRNSQGVVLFTTRNKKAASRMAPSGVLTVSGMEEHAATTFLTKSLSLEQPLEQRDVPELLRQLTYLPLAITQAAAYITANTISISEYLSLLKDTEENVVGILGEDFEDEGRYRASKNPVATTWLISFNQIQQHDPLAAEYLSFMSCLDPRNIPSSLLPPTEPKKKFVEALGILKAYSFITNRPRDESFDIHRLVHLAMRNWLRKENQLSLWIGRVTVRLAEAFPDISHENRAIWSPYFLHAQCVLRLPAPNLKPKDFDERFALIEKVGLCLVYYGRYTEASDSFSSVLEWRQERLGEEHEDTLRSTDNVVNALLNLHDFVAAERVGRQAFEKRRKLLGEEDPATLSSMTMLVWAQFNIGQRKESEALGAQVLEITRRVLGEDHNDTVMMTSILAIIYFAQRRWDEAVKLAEQVIATSKRLLGEEHPYTLRSLHSLAKMYFELYRLSDAEELGLQATETQIRVLGEEHIDTLNSMTTLGATYSAQRRLPKAEMLETRVLEIKKRSLGQEHPETLMSMFNLALTYGRQGRSKDAVDLETKVLEVRKRVLGEEHSNTLKSMNNLATYYGTSRERLDEVEKLRLQVLEARKRLLGEEDPETLVSMSNLAIIWALRNRDEEAIALSKQAVRLAKKVLGPSHPHTLEFTAVLVRIQTAALRRRFMSHLRNPLTIFYREGQQRRIGGPAS